MSVVRRPRNTWLWRSCVAPRRSQVLNASSGEASGGGGSRSRIVTSRLPSPKASATPSPAIPAPATRIFSVCWSCRNLCRGPGECTPADEKCESSERRHDTEAANARKSQRYRASRRTERYPPKRNAAAACAAPAPVRAWQERQAPSPARDKSDSARLFRTLPDGADRAYPAGRARRTRRPRPPEIR